MEWKDVFAEVIAMVAVVVTVLTVIVAWQLSRTYSSHVEELQKIGGDYSKLFKDLENVVRRNEAVTHKTVLSLRTLFDLVMIKSRIERYETQLETLTKTSLWKDRSLSADETAAKAGLIGVEVESVRRTAVARESELYWLVGTATEQAAYLHALIDTNGDDRSLELLENFTALSQPGTEREEMLQATAALRQRLGKPRRLKRNVILSSTWTGRPN